MKSKNEFIGEINESNLNEVKQNDDSLLFDNYLGLNENNNNDFEDEIFERKWILQNHLKYESKNCIKYTTFNILAENLKEHTVKDFIPWEKRREKLLQIIKNSNSDIFSLQELEDDKYFLEKLSNEYTYILKLRSGKPEGLGIFWKNEFVLLESFYLNYLYDESSILSKPNLGIFVVLKRRNDIFLVGNTHLLFNSNRGEIKLAQIAMFIKGLEMIQKRYKDELKVIFSGDLNSLPSSAIIEYLKKGEINTKRLSRFTVSRQKNMNFINLKYWKQQMQTRFSYETYKNFNQNNEFEEIFYFDLELKKNDRTDCPFDFELKPYKIDKVENDCSMLYHKFSFFSAQNPAATFFTSNALGTVDYIFHDKSFIPLAFLSIPSPEILISSCKPKIDREFNSNKLDKFSFKNQNYYPSDHISLTSFFLIKNK